ECAAQNWRVSRSATSTGALHPSGGHFQSSLAGLRAGTRHLSMEELRPRRQTRQDDPDGHGVLTSLLLARAPQKVRTHPSLRLSGESLSHLQSGAVPATAGPQFPCTHKNWTVQTPLRGCCPLVLPPLRRGHDRDAEIHSRGIIPMRLLRFFVAFLSRAFQTYSHTPMHS